MSSILEVIKLEKHQDTKLDFIDNAKISWDFSKIDLKGKYVAIELVTIYDCFNGENASDFKSQFTILNKENFKIKGSHDLIHLDLMAKCFKWRIILQGTNGIQVSDWSYFSFLK
ncbi:hypothetical protein NAT47_05725 [Flavobacterium sp. HXWNR69]|uniref:Uncharacterized protein n=1 Tax=Flavobacterium fragile TaxID=2949085 RepID=A0ABT0TG00_9FLAO|nr:hypothetical protein [Flavobacterium sp. HXWNR69]MCL9769910.1 hypothetical protein [Flavobacterium sp. HXWNR69]